MRHSHCAGLLGIAGLVVLASACQPAAQQQEAAPSAQPAPPTTTAVSDEVQIRAALEPLAPAYRRCQPLVVALNAALSAQKDEAKAAAAFSACQEPVNEKTRTVMAELKKRGLDQERITAVVNQWRNEQASGKPGAGGGGDKEP